jgi:hypothetical protein
MSKRRRHHHHNHDYKKQENGFNFNNLAEILKNINFDEVLSLIGQKETKTEELKEEKSIGQEEILNAFRVLLNADKIKLVNTLIELYSASKNKLKK